MKYFRFSFLYLIALPIFAANEVVVSDDGREVMLNADGTWEFVSEDRFATTKDGSRVRLRKDGSWQRMQVPIAKLLQPTNSGIAIGDFVIEAVRTARHKNTKARKQMIIDILIDVDSERFSELSLADVELRDSKGRIYELNSLKPTVQGFRLIADDSPAWWGVKYFEIVLIAPETIRLRKHASDVIRRDVAELTR